MQHCPSCNIHIAGNKSGCPLCGGKLHGDPTPAPFPYIAPPKYSMTFLVKLVSVIAIAAIVVCVTINMMIPTKVAWCFFAVAGILCAWITSAVGIYTRSNILKNITFQLFLVTLFAVAWDYATGWRNWSIDYVLPCMCMAVMACMFVLSITFKMKPEDYLIYWGLNALYGIVPVIFLLTGQLRSIYPSAICFALSCIMSAFILIFQGKSLRDLIVRKFHF